jgi:hypothetical protein
MGDLKLLARGARLTRSRSDQWRTTEAGPTQLKRSEA